MHVISITAWESLTRFTNYPSPAERNNHRVGGNCVMDVIELLWLGLNQRKLLGIRRGDNIKWEKEGGGSVSHINLGIDLPWTELLQSGPLSIKHLALNTLPPTCVTTSPKRLHFAKNKLFWSSPTLFISSRYTDWFNIMDVRSVACNIAMPGVCPGVTGCSVVGVFLLIFARKTILTISSLMVSDLCWLERGINGQNQAPGQRFYVSLRNSCWYPWLLGWHDR